MGRGRIVTAYETALLEQIAFLRAELDRYRDERRAVELAETDKTPLGWALRDPGFRAWLLKKQLEGQVRA